MNDNDSSTLQDGQTSLFLAARNGHIHVVMYLHQNGVNINADDTTAQRKEDQVDYYMCCESQS